MRNRLFDDYILSFYLSEASRCLLCHDPVCSRACPQNAPTGDIIKSLYFENYFGATRKIGTTDCTYCNAPCERACVLSHKGIPVRIRQINMGLGVSR